MSAAFRQKMLLLTVIIVMLCLPLPTWARTDCVPDKYNCNCEAIMSTPAALPPLQVGDIIFILMGTPLFKQVAKDTGSWTNHVGIIVNVDGKEPMVAESRFPFSTLTPLSKFIARSVGKRVEIKRLQKPLDTEQQEKLMDAVKSRLGIFYDAGFNLHSRRQFCSRFVYEVVLEASDQEVGNIESLENLLGKNPNANLRFWKAWYLGRIPWHRLTVTPASILQSETSHTIYQFPERG